MQTAKITCKVICNGDSVSVRSPSTSSISRQLCHDGSRFLELKTQSCIYTNINACFESNQVVLPLNLIFSVVDGALSSQHLKQQSCSVTSTQRGLMRNLLVGNIAFYDC